MTQKIFVRENFVSRKRHKYIKFGVGENVFLEKAYCRKFDVLDNFRNAEFGVGEIF